jgi:beta-lactamase superfamily II metal-dependent hydrolase
MSLEIDMLDVSNGDAIVVRYVGDNGRTEWVGLIDGGETEDDGMKVVQHVRRYTVREEIDDMICSHSDSDHIGGLPTVVRNIGVGRVWIHDPARHIDMSAVRWHWQRSYSTAARKIEKSMQQCSDFLAHLDRMRIPRAEPFAGQEVGLFQVLGPTRRYYEELLQQFDKLDGVFVEEERAEEPIYLSQFKEAANPDAVIDEDNETSAENDSSVISRIVYNGSVLLFTGDAGVPALERAIIPYGVSNVTWLDMPHHGSKHNVNSSVLNRLMPDVAYFSARGTRKHPSVAVINALKRRGCTCYSTHKSGNLLHPIGIGLRQGWVPAEPL